MKLQEGLVMRSNQEQALLPHWRPVPTALMLPEHHSASSAAQLGGRKQGQGDKWGPWRGITCAAGAVDEAGQGPGKESHSPHSSNVQEGTCCLGRQKNQGVSQHRFLSPKYTCSNARDLHLQPVLLGDAQYQGGRDRTDSLLCSSHRSSGWWQLLQAGLQGQEEHLAWPGTRSQGQGINLQCTQPC